MWNTVAGSILTIGGEYNYREGVSVWYRSFLAFQPDPSLMADAPLGFQLHALVAFGLFALWPFTRLVHVFSAPVGYLTRPYIVYRSRDEHAGQSPAASRLGPGRLSTDDCRRARNVVSITSDSQRHGGGARTHRDGTCGSGR